MLYRRLNFAGRHRPPEGYPLCVRKDPGPGTSPGARTQGLRPGDLGPKTRAWVSGSGSPPLCPLFGTCVRGRWMGWLRWMGSGASGRVKKGLRQSGCLGGKQHGGGEGGKTCAFAGNEMLLWSTAKALATSS